MIHCDTLVIGHVSQDIIVTPEAVENLTGGAVIHAAVAAQRMGCSVAALTKLNPDDLDMLEVFALHDIPVVYRESKETTSIRNIYRTPDRDRRTCEAIKVADPFVIEDLGDAFDADLYYLGGLIAGDFPEPFVAEIAKRGKIAVDVQAFVRVNENGRLVFRDWESKRSVLPHVHYLKTDEAEAESLTGVKDRAEAARILSQWGAKEVLLTHATEVMVLADGERHTFPFTARNLSGRTGRGDTCFSAYCNGRRSHSPREACRFAAAITSLKMESPGPFSGGLDDVKRAIEERYKDCKP